MILITCVYRRLQREHHTKPDKMHEHTETIQCSLVHRDYQFTVDVFASLYVVINQQET